MQRYSIRPARMSAMRASATGGSLIADTLGSRRYRMRRFRSWRTAYALPSSGAPGRAPSERSPSIDRCCAIVRVLQPQEHAEARQVTQRKWQRRCHVLADGLGMRTAHAEEIGGACCNATSQYIQLVTSPCLVGASHIGVRSLLAIGARQRRRRCSDVRAPMELTAPCTL